MRKSAQHPVEQVRSWMSNIWLRSQDLAHDPWIVDAATSTDWEAELPTLQRKTFDRDCQVSTQSRLLRTQAFL